jgi:hypothetical protein
VPRVRNCLVLLLTLAWGALWITSSARAQIPTFDNGPPLLAPGTDRSLTILISDLQSSLTDSPNTSDLRWVKLSPTQRVSLTFRRAALSLASRADELGPKGHPHALAARQLAAASATPQPFTTRIDESLIDHAAREIQSPWPEEHAALSAELRRRLGIFITGDESTLTWSGVPVAPATTPTGVEALDRAVRGIETAFAPTLPLAAFAPARNHTRALLTRACQHARGDSGLTGSALTIYHARFTTILNALSQSPFDSAELQTLVESADLVTLIFPSSKVQPKPASDPLASLSTAEREAITRFALSSGPQSMTADRIDTAREWFASMTRLAASSGKPRPMPPPLKQLDKVITARALASSKDGGKGLSDLFRTQTSPRDPAVLAGLSALRKAQADLDSLDHLRTLFSSNDTWNDQFPLAAARFTKLGVEFQNPAKRDAALNTLRTWASGTDLLISLNDLSLTSLTDPSCLATATRIDSVATLLLNRKTSLLNSKAEPPAATLDTLHRHISDLRSLASIFRGSASFLQFPIDPAARHALLSLTPGLHLTDSAWQELTSRARASHNTFDAMLDQWAKGTPPSAAAVLQLKDDLAIAATLGRAGSITHMPPQTKVPQLFLLLCGTPPHLADNASAVSALCRAVEAHVAAVKYKDANAIPLLSLARSAAARVESDAKQSK